VDLAVKAAMGSSSLQQFAERTLVIIPAHNEAGSVAQVVTRLRALGFSRVRVVDNGSTDATSENASAAGAEVVRETGIGYGLACWSGGCSMPGNVDWLLYANADASDDYAAYETFAALAPGHDLIIGARTYTEDRDSMTMPQRFGNWLAPFLIQVFWRRKFADLGPQRAIRVNAYQQLDLQDRGFGWTVEMQVRAVEEGLKIIEIPVHTYPRIIGQSKISGNFRGSVMAGLIILSTIGQLVWRKWVRALHRRPVDSRQIKIEKTRSTI